MIVATAIKRCGNVRPSAFGLPISVYLGQSRQQGIVHLLYFASGSQIFHLLYFASGSQTPSPLRTLTRVLAGGVWIPTVDRKVPGAEYPQIDGTDQAASLSSSRGSLDHAKAVLTHH
ncbi:hypothetical protein BGZ47_000336 [Haplosporangium gracile]|nr:hypothetical protein BGZ47_000336 [Haplosporangium gracile]